MKQHYYVGPAYYEFPYIVITDSLNFLDNEDIMYDLAEEVNENSDWREWERQAIEAGVPTRYDSDFGREVKYEDDVWDLIKDWLRTSAIPKGDFEGPATLDKIEREFDITLTDKELQELETKGYTLVFDADL